MKGIFTSFVAMLLVAGLVGCGNSERHAARQKFKEAVAAMKVRTQGSTYAEFRQAELDLKTNYEVNKVHLDDVHDQFTDLNSLMTATDVCWSYSINSPKTWVHPRAKYQSDVWQAMQFVSPANAEKANAFVDQATGKLNVSIDQIEEDANFYPKHYVKAGLAKISDRSDDLLKSLAK